MAIFFDDFVGTAGTLLSSRPGWMTGAGYYNVLELDGAGGIGFPATGDGTAVVYDTGSLRHYVKVVLGSGFFLDNRSVGLLFGYKDRSIGYRVTWNTDRLELLSGGTILRSLAGPWAVGDTLEIIFDSAMGNVKFKRNSVEHSTTNLTQWPGIGARVGVEIWYGPRQATTDIIRSFEADALPAADTTAPVLTGDISVDSRTLNAIATTCPEATDDVAVTRYHVRLNGGSWLDKGLSRSHTYSGLNPPGQTYTIEWSALDAMNNRSNILSASAKTFSSGATANSVRLTTGPQDDNPAGLLYDLAGTVAAGDWLNYEVISGPTPPGGTFSASPMGAFSYVGPSPAVLVIQPYVNDVATAEPITVNLYDQVGGGDTESPTLTGVITVNSKTSTSINVSCPVATDNVGVDHYEWSKDAGATWVNGTTTHNFEGLTLSTTYPIRARAADAAGLKSIPALELSVTTDAAAVPPVLPGGITVVSKTQTAINVSCQEATGDVTGYEWSRDGGTTWESGATTHSFTGLTAATPYAIRARAFGPGGISAVLSLTVTTDPAVTGAALTSSPQVNNTTTVQANVTGITVHVYDAATGDKVVTKTGQSTDANGVMVLSDALLTAGTTYRFVVVYSGGDEGMEKAVAS